MTNIPLESQFIDFLRYMQWTDMRVYHAQPDNYVRVAWLNFRIKYENGTLQ